MKFKSLYPNKTYKGCHFNDKCEFETVSQKVIDMLRADELYLMHFIWEEKNEPASESNADKGIGGQGNAEIQAKPEAEVQEVVQKVTKLKKTRKR